MVLEDRISVVIADDQSLFREGLRLMLHWEESIQIVGEAANRPQTMYAVSDLKPDVLLFNIIIPETDPAALIPLIREKSPNTKLLLHGGAIDEAAVIKAIKAGAKGYIRRDASASRLIRAIQTVHQGGLWIRRELLPRFFEREAVSDARQQDNPGVKTEGLTPREKEILHCLTMGYSNNEIARDLFISDKTVKRHLNNVFKKLHITRRLQATHYAINNGLA